VLDVERHLAGGSASRARPLSGQQIVRMRRSGASSARYRAPGASGGHVGIASAKIVILDVGRTPFAQQPGQSTKAASDVAS
jgi:hypothetical protein